MDLGGSWDNVQDQNNSCKARSDVEEDGRVRGMGLGDFSIFVKIVEYVHRIVMPDQMLRRVGGMGLGGSCGLLCPSLSPVEWSDGCRRGRNQSPRSKTETESRNKTKFQTETRNKTETKTKSIKQSGGMKPLTDGC